MLQLDNFCFLHLSAISTDTSIFAVNERILFIYLLFHLIDYYRRLFDSRPLHSLSWAQEPADLHSHPGGTMRRRYVRSWHWRVGHSFCSCAPTTARRSLVSSDTRAMPCHTQRDGTASLARNFGHGVWVQEVSAACVGVTHHRPHRPCCPYLPHENTNPLANRDKSWISCLNTSQSNITWVGFWNTGSPKFRF